MNKRLLLATTAAVALATSALAQSSPSTSSSNPSATQRQQDSTSTTPSSSTSKPSSSSSSGSAQTNLSTNSAQTQPPSSTGQSAAGQTSNSGPGTNTTQAPTPNNSTNQAQTSQPSSQTNPPANQAQTNPPANNPTQSAAPSAAGTNQAQSPTGSTTAQQPNNQQNKADRSSNPNVNVSVNINDQQRTRLSTSISQLNVQPLNNVNFSLSVGTAVPRDVRLRSLPAEVVEIVPQYRGYNFVLVKEEIVIVEPSSYKIVAVLPYSGRSTAAAPARTEQRKATFSDNDREVIRKHAKARPVERERRTTGSTVRTEIRTGERVPEGVEIEAFPEEVYRDAPTLREYRYINRDSRTYIVEPHERRIIEEID
ncbi:DUF1236 domain-containing protein [Tardiphaga robiniae]|uniref:DUF1236 domain-containing protein n=1 Tax=Tardiphaga robiniae TaxID=943830 RepID=A0A7G6U842_9BRAD|nr:DUF1236 domain-containing protein [Tardiphaga robiniae]QND75174.1 DUF1236 domain-containing protein [Tardiphaga robiniae]